MSEKKDKKFDYKEKLIDEIPEEFRPKEEVPFDPENVTIKELLDMSDLVQTVLKILPKEHHEVYKSYVDSLVEKNQKHLEIVREKLKDKDLVKEIFRGIVSKKRTS